MSTKKVIATILSQGETMDDQLIRVINSVLDNGVLNAAFAFKGGIGVSRSFDRGDSPNRDLHFYYIPSNKIPASMVETSLSIVLEGPQDMVDVNNIQSSIVEQDPDRFRKLEGLGITYVHEHAWRVTETGLSILQERIQHSAMVVTEVQGGMMMLQLNEGGAEQVRVATAQGETKHRDCNLPSNRIAALFLPQWMQQYVGRLTSNGARLHFVPDVTRKVEFHFKLKGTSVEQGAVTVSLVHPDFASGLTQLFRGRDICTHILRAR